MKIRYLPIDDRNNLRVLRHTTDQTVIEAILGSIFKRPYYTLQILWEYRKWFFELTDEQLEANPSLACGLAQLLIISGDLGRAEKVINSLPESSPYKTMSALMFPGNSPEQQHSLMKQIMDNGWKANGPILTAGRPSIMNGAWDFSPYIDQMAENKEQTLEIIKTLYPENYESIYDVAQAEALY